MSASDAAPLPRLGEVFFDVRGNSRSMRLSWYADTGVAVFSIWQGGVCTGTFRLPMGDLARMVEILQRGPQRHRGQRGPDDYGSADYENADYGPGDYGTADYGGGRGPARAGDYPPTDYPPADYADRDFPTGTYWREDEGSFQSDATGQERFSESDRPGYDQDRFVPPYVEAQGESYLNDNPVADSDRRGGFDEPAYPAADPGTGARHSAGRHSSQRARSRGRAGQADTDVRTAGNRAVEREYRDI
jgi:hypothetical protein